MLKQHRTTVAKFTPGISLSLADLMYLQGCSRELDWFQNPPKVQRKQGVHRSRFKGRGMSFSEVRAYQPGDDVRTIDWRVTARTGEAHTKVFTEERERPIHVLLDLSPSMYFGSQTILKANAAIYAAAIIGWATLKHQDRFGCLINSANSHFEFRPSGKSQQLLSIFEKCIQTHTHITTHFGASHDKPTSWQDALNRWRHLVRPGGLSVIISDFYKWGNDAQQAIRSMTSHSEIMLINVVDPLELTIPFEGVLPVTDGSDTFYARCNSNSSQHLLQMQKQRLDSIDQFARQQGIQQRQINTREFQPKEMIQQLNKAIDSFSTEALYVGGAVV
jgi:uncharacterized protein (DUF58 family)